MPPLGLSRFAESMGKDIVANSIDEATGTDYASTLNNASDVYDLYKILKSPTLRGSTALQGLGRFGVAGALAALGIMAFPSETNSNEDYQLYLQQLEQARKKEYVKEMSKLLNRGK